MSSKRPTRKDILATASIKDYRDKATALWFIAMKLVDPVEDLEEPIDILEGWNEEAEVERNDYKLDKSSEESY